MRYMAVICLIFFIMPMVHAATIGMSPSSIAFDAKKDVSYDKEIILFNTGDNDLQISLQSSASWISVPEKVTVAAQSTSSILVNIFPKKEFPNGNHSGHIILSHQSGVIAPSLLLPVSVILSEEESIDLILKDIAVQSAEVDNVLPVTLSLYNNGNVDTAANIMFAIQNDNLALKTINQQVTVKPYSFFQNTTKIDTLNLVPGKYNLNFSMKYSNGTSIAQMLKDVDLVPFGTFSREITITQIFSEIADVTTITVELMNTGQVPVTTYIEGQFYNKHSLMHVEQSKESPIAVGEKINMSLYLKEKIKDQLTVRVRAFYNGKETEVKTVQLYDEKRKNWLYLVVIIVLIIITALGMSMYMLYRRRRQKQQPSCVSLQAQPIV